MKYLIASDLHGSGSCTRQLLERCAAEGADMLVLLGDLLYHGPRNNLPGEYDPKIVSALLNEHKEHIIAVRGNCEAEVDQMMLEFPCMADYTYLWLENTPVFVTHGHRYNNHSLPPLATPRTILLHGHTHIPANETFSTHRWQRRLLETSRRRHRLHAGCAEQRRITTKRSHRDTTSQGLRFFHSPP